MARVNREIKATLEHPVTVGDILDVLEEFPRNAPVRFQYGSDQREGTGWLTVISSW